MASTVYLLHICGLVSLSFCSPQHSRQILW